MGQTYLKYTVLAAIACTMSFAVSQSTTASTLVSQASARRFQPLPANTCHQLRSQMSQTLKVKATLTRASFKDYINNGQGMGCKIAATGNGRNFNELRDVANNLKAMLIKQGWKEDPQYAADGPTGAGMGFRKGNSLSLLMVEWEPAPGANCPPNEPISDCKLSPEQQIYRITLNSARR